MSANCKRCLLLESGEKSSFEEIRALIGQMDNEIKIGGDEYLNRLDFCKKCEFLISGMCRKCGCYVELRAIQKSQHCPDADDVKW